MDGVCVSFKGLWSFFCTFLVRLVEDSAGWSYCILLCLGNEDDGEQPLGVNLRALGDVKGQ